MKIETSQITKVALTEVEGLDTITVILENFEPGKGKIIIECWGKSWSSYWGGMSGDPVEDFFCRCDQHYLAGNLSPGLDSEIEDIDGLADHARADICRRRRELELEEGEARELFDLSERLDGVVSLESDSTQEAMHEIFGDEWWYGLPSKPNPDYEYLCQIIKAVQSGLAMMKQDIAA